MKLATQWRDEMRLDLKASVTASLSIANSSNLSNTNLKACALYRGASPPVRAEN